MTLWDPVTFDPRRLGKPQEVEKFFKGVPSRWNLVHKLGPKRDAFPFGCHGNSFQSADSRVITHFSTKCDQVWPVDFLLSCWHTFKTKKMNWEVFGEQGYWFLLVYCQQQPVYLKQILHLTVREPTARRGLLFLQFYFILCQFKSSLRRSRVCVCVWRDNKNTRSWIIWAAGNVIDKEKLQAALFSTKLFTEEWCFFISFPNEGTR